VRILVTGGTGFLGSHLVEALLERGHRVVCLVRDEAKARELFGQDGPVLVRGDLLDRVALRAACEGVEAVAHLAGLTSARGREEFFQVNAGGTRALVEAVAAAGGSVGRFVYVSSLAAAGPVRRGDALRAGDGVGPVSHYGASKRAGEEPVRALELEWTILRPPAVYGPRDREFLRLFRSAARGVVPVFGEGEQELSLVYALDLVEAIVGCLEAGPPGEVHYPTHEQVVTARELGLAIATAVTPGRAPRLLRVPRAVVRPLLWVTGGAARLAGRATILSPDKAGELLAEAWTCSPALLEERTGWRARTALAEGLARTAAWYRDVGWL
jgi:nucleoside-diphosphate-sugar epimerase